MVTTFVESTFLSHILRREIKELYLTVAISGFAVSMLFIFEPIFLFTLGVPLWGIALYYALVYFAYIFLFPIGAKLAARFGFEHMILVSRPLYALYLFVLFHVQSALPLIILAPLVLAVAKSAYWPAYHADFSRYGSARYRGTEISGLRFMTTSVGVLGPAAGGILVATFGFGTLFIVVSIIMLLSTIPLFTTRERFIPGSFSYTEPFRMLFSRRYFRQGIAYMGYAEEVVHTSFWPIFLFLVIGGFSQLGAIASVAIFATAIVTFMIGKLSDRSTYKKVIFFAVPFVAMSYLLRPLVATVPAAFGLDVFSRVSRAGVTIPLRSIIYNRGRREGNLRYTSLAELPLQIGKLGMCLLLAVVFFLFDVPVAFVIAFTLAALASLLYLFAPRGVLVE